MGDRPISKPPTAKDKKRKRYAHIQTQCAFEFKIPPRSSSEDMRATSHASTAIHTVFSMSFIDSPGSVVRIVASLWAGRSAVRIPVGAGDFISAPESPDRLRDPSSLPFIGYPSSFPECDCNHPPPYSAEVTNDCSYTSTTRRAFMGWTGKTSSSLIFPLRQRLGLAIHLFLSCFPTEILK